MLGPGWDLDDMAEEEIVAYRSPFEYAFDVDDEVSSMEVGTLWEGDDGEILIERGEHDRTDVTDGLQRLNIGRDGQRVEEAGHWLIELGGNLSLFSTIIRCERCEN